MKYFKKTGSKIIASLLSLMVMFSLVQLPVHAAEISGDGYSLDKSTGVLTLSTNEGTTKWRSDSSILRRDVKSVILTDNVTEIGNSAFNMCSNLTEINTNKVTIIGSNSLTATGLQNIVMPEVTTIANQALNSINNIKILYMPKITSLGDYVFMMSVVDELALPSTPPTSANDTFSNGTISNVIFINKNGDELSGIEKKDALDAYKATAGYSNDKWYGITLPELTDQEKLTIVKTTLEEKFKTLSVSNDTKDSEIMKIVTDTITTLGFADVTASWDTVKGFSLEQATSSKIGTITGTINLACGATAKDLVALNTTIAKLPKTDKEKLAEAKPLAQSALDGITATNDTIDANILDVVNRGIASIGGVTATWKTEPAITKATNSANGSITGTIVLTCGTETAEITVNKTINELPSLTPEKPAIIVGDNGTIHQVGNSYGMIFTCSGKLEDLTGIYVDGKMIGSSNYTLKSGSTILTLKASYLDGLSIGKHTLKFQYKDNLSADTTFTITAKETAKQNSPQTGDISSTMMYLSLIALSGSVLLFILRKKTLLNK